MMSAPPRPAAWSERRCCIDTLARIGRRAEARALLRAPCAHDLPGVQARMHPRDVLERARRVSGFAPDGQELATDGQPVRASADPIGLDAA